MSIPLPRGNIESLNDMVTAITGNRILERIPDSVFDNADQVKLVDIEPQELLERLASENRSDASEGDSFSFTLEKLTALRELALRRCADRVNKRTEAAVSETKATIIQMNTYWSAFLLLRPMQRSSGQQQEWQMLS